MKGDFFCMFVEFWIHGAMILCVGLWQHTISWQRLAVEEATHLKIVRLKSNRKKLKAWGSNVLHRDASNDITSSPLDSLPSKSLQYHHRQRTYNHNPLGNTIPIRSIHAWPCRTLLPWTSCSLPGLRYSHGTEGVHLQHKLKLDSGFAGAFIRRQEQRQRGKMLWGVKIRCKPIRLVRHF